MPKKQTIQARLIAGLERNGYVELTSTRYVGCRAFRPPNVPNTLVFVGKGGSLRSGQNRTTSRNCSAKFRALLLGE